MIEELDDVLDQVTISVLIGRDGVDLTLPYIDYEKGTTQETKTGIFISKIVNYGL